jgi:site-specific DNA-cytosine methylase
MDADQMTLELAQDAPRRSMQRLVLPFRVLVACEYSGTVRDAFAARGHDAMSCDILPTDKPGKHYQGDVRDVLDDGWDLMICHPPCTYLSVSGIHWNNRGRGWEETEKALDFVRLLMGANIPRIALENPVSIISSRIRKPDQIIHPHQFGHDASKATCLWLKNLPKLQPTENVPPRIVNGKPRWANQTDGGQNKLAPSDDRWKLRSTTYPGIAAAMAFHWENTKLSHEEGGKEQL